MNYFKKYWMIVALIIITCSITVYARSFDIPQIRLASKPYNAIIREATNQWKLSPALIQALLWKESRFNPKAVNKKTGARGIAQFVRSGAAAVGRLQKARGLTNIFNYNKAFDPVQAIPASCELINYLIHRCKSLPEAIGAYNTGYCTVNTFARSVIKLKKMLENTPTQSMLVLEDKPNNYIEIEAHNTSPFTILIEAKCDWNNNTQRFDFHKFYKAPSKSVAIMAVPNRHKRCEVWSRVKILGNK